MKVCPNCNASYEGDMKFCLQCGTPLADAPVNEAPVNEAPAQEPQFQQPVQEPQFQQPAYAQPAPVAADPFDHTAEFDAADISDNKVFAMLPYLFGFVGIIVAMLAAKESAYTKFHIRQALKITISSYLVLFITLVFCWTFIIPIAGGVCSCILFVLVIIAFIQVCKGQAKEPAIIKNFKFFK